MGVMDLLERWILRTRRVRWVHLGVVVLRLLVGFAFVPAGMKKVLDEPFTDPGKTGPFHDFLHAFHATGFFYQFVGAVQLTCAVLLVTQLHASAGAVLALPVLTTIMVFCWSTAVYPTATVVTLMLVAALALAAWDLPRWRGRAGGPALVDEQVWALCGVAILVVYGGLCLATGEVYRPRGGERTIGFYVISALPLLPLVTWWIERRRRRSAGARRAGASG